MRCKAKQGKQDAGLDDGFSLVELMVVVFLLALASTFIILSAPAATPKHIVEAERLAGYLELAAQRAQISGQPSGVYLDGSSAVGATRQMGLWVRQPSSRIDLSGQVDARVIQPKDETGDMPLFLFGPLGGARPVELQLSRGQGSVTLRVTHDGAITLVGAANEEPF